MTARREPLPNMALQTNHRQLGSIDLGCRLVPYFGGRIDSVSAVAGR